VDNIRELERLAALRPAEAPCKVFIVDGAETMTGAAPQAFLAPDQPISPQVTKFGSDAHLDFTVGSASSGTTVLS